MWTLNVTLKKNCHINHAKNMRDRKCFFLKLKQDPDPGFKILICRKNFYSQRIPEAWNQIPAEIKQAKNARCFRNQYQNHRHGQAAAAHAVT